MSLDKVNKYIKEFEKTITKPRTNFDKSKFFVGVDLGTANIMITILDKDGNFSGLKYSSLPSGHELNSFILGLYNVAGPGQKVAAESLEKIEKINKPINIKIGISLSCTKCPKTVQATQRIATLNKNVEMEMINIFTFQDFKNRYDIMSVPAIIVDDQHIYFGEKTVEDMLEIINK